MRIARRTPLVAVLAALATTLALGLGTPSDARPGHGHGHAAAAVDPVGLIGMSALTSNWAAYSAQVEATGGHLEARRLFFGSLGANLNLVQQAKNEGLYPVTSFKVGSWAPVANGQSDAALRTLAGRLDAFNIPLAVVIHHEPDTQSNPPDQGEGGSAVDFRRMQNHVINVMRPLCDLCDFDVIMNGWWWNGRSAALTDAQIDVWLPLWLRQKLDVVAADDYENAVTPVVSMRNRVAWANRVGGVTATGTGEIGARSVATLNEAFTFAHDEPLYDGGWILYYNSRDWVLDGVRLAAFQDILLHWHD